MRPVEVGPSLERFAISGRLALRQGDRRDFVDFDWSHSRDRDVVLFLSPLGQGLAEIARDATGVALVMPGREAVRAADFAELARQVLGAPLPFDVLADWVRGARGVTGIADDWQVEVTESVPFRQRRLPRRVEVRRGDVELVIVIVDWADGE